MPLVMRGGTLMLYGVCHKDHDLVVNPFWINDAEITIRGSYNNPNTMARALDLLISGRLNADAVATHRYPLDKALEAFKATGSDDCLKILVEP
jgi:L-iditol 2-dehydrogenase